MGSTMQTAVAGVVLRNDATDTCINGCAIAGSGDLNQF